MKGSLVCQETKVKGWFEMFNSKLRPLIEEKDRLCHAIKGEVNEELRTRVFGYCVCYWEGEDFRGCVVARARTTVSSHFAVCFCSR